MANLLEKNLQHETTVQAPGPNPKIPFLLATFGWIQFSKLSTNSGS
jgi:hypothetical protein